MADRIPQEFLDWLEANYNWAEVYSWKQMHRWGTQWQTDPVFQYWAANVSPIAYPTARGLGQFPERGIPPTPKTLASDNVTEIQNIRDKLERAADTDNATEVQLRLKQLVDYGDMTKADANYYYNSIFPPLPEPESPLTTRERQLGLEEAKNAVLWSPWVPETDKQMIKGEEGQKLEKSYLAGESKDFMDVLANMYNRAQTTEKEYWSKKTEREAFQAQKEATKYQMQGIPPKPQREALPSLEEPVEQYVEKAGLGQGTKLRQYLETAFLPSIAQETAQARSKWWKEIHPEAVLRSPGFMPGMVNVLRGVTEKPQELAEMAEDIYKRSTEGGGGHAWWYKPPARRKEEDPFLKKLRERQLKPEYYRLPGAGLVPRLTPAVRY